MRTRVGWIIGITVVIALLPLLAACGQSSTATTEAVSTSAAAVPASETTATTAPGSSVGSNLTVGTTEGPYYVTGTAQLTRGNLNYTGLPGDPIQIVGHVYSGIDTSKPLAGAKIEIWQADSNGVYHPEGNGDIGKFGAAEIALRGFVLTDSSGAYQFTTIYPGYYQGRTRHIHVRASAEGYGGVITQIIVPAKPGDGTTPENDMIAQSLPQANFVTFSDKNGIQTASFDFFIAPD